MNAGVMILVCHVHWSLVTFVPRTVPQHTAVHMLLDVLIDVLREVLSLVMFQFGFRMVYARRNTE